MPNDFLKLSPKISVLPVIHGSGDFAVEVRRTLLSHKFDCLAVPLPESFQEDVETAVEFLPNITAVVQREPMSFNTEWSPERDADEDDDFDDDPTVSYVPVDPCQPVIAALRFALQERMPRAFVDLETANFVELNSYLPDPYALKNLPVEKFAAGVLPALPPLPDGQPQERVAHMAARLRELEQRFDSILFLCSFWEWPWVKDTYLDQKPAGEHDEVAPTEICSVDLMTLLFFLGELPFVTGLYEQARAELDDDENLSIDGIKTLLLETRDRYKQELGTRARKITPNMLSHYFRYVRNLALIERRMTPDMYSLIIAAKQIAGDQFAITLAETIREYPFESPSPWETLRMGHDEMHLPDGDIVEAKNRLPGPSIEWRSCELKPKPMKIDQEKWTTRWNPFGQCSWPPEDVAIERFRTHVKDHALQILGNDLAQSEKFTASMKDGLDIRETLRNWHTGDLYVKVLPPARGELDCVIMLFDTPADPRDYPWRITWQAEHHDESTLTLFATDFGEEMIGPGIAQATYGGAMFLFPPRPVGEIWRDPRFDFVDTLEERLIVGACYYSRHKHIAVLSESAPGLGWRRLAKRFGKKLVHVPLAHFSQETIQQLRMFHVLNGQHIRSYAAHFIRKA